MVMHASVRDMRGHLFHGALAAQFQKFAVAGGVEGEKGAAVMEALGPFGPTARRVFSFDGDDGRALPGIPGVIEALNFVGRQREHSNERCSQVRGL